MAEPMIGVIGAGDADSELGLMAERVGALIADSGFTLVCGGLGGVMEAAARGCRSAGGKTVGILPGHDPASANPYIDVAVPTGMGEMRNMLLVRASAVLIAIGGGYGTLSEIALALKTGKPVIGLRTWDITGGVRPASTPEEAVGMAVAAVTDG